MRSLGVGDHSRDGRRTNELGRKVFAGHLPLLVAPNFNAKALNLSGENVSVLARRVVALAMAVLASNGTIAMFKNPEPVHRHVPRSLRCRPFASRLSMSDVEAGLWCVRPL